MYINGNYYLPTFYFEFLLDIGLFIILILVRKYVKNPKNGLLTGLYFSIYSIGRFFIEGLRTDSLMLGNLRIARAISIILFLIGLFLIFYKQKDTRTNRLKKALDN